MRICKKCVLNNFFPGISFNSSGICNFCISSKREKNKSSRKQALLEFKKLIQDNSLRRPYQILMCWSGGKDSTYTLYVLVKKFRLNVLAYTVDNGFLADQTYSNLKKVSLALGIDHIIFKPDLIMMKRLFKNSLTGNSFSNITIERSSQACASCIGLVKYSAFRMAIDKKIPMIAFGWTPGQNSLSSGIFRLTRPMFKEMKETYISNMKKLGVDVFSDHTNELSTMNESDLPYLVHPSAFIAYDEKNIYRIIKKLGWIKPKKLDANSTNCKMNSLAVLEHMKRYGFNPYSSELARLVRGGYLTRREALRRLSAKLDSSILNEVQKKLDLKEVI